jgi:hypothetical protein
MSLRNFTGRRALAGDPAISLSFRPRGRRRNVAARAARRRQAFAQRGLWQRSGRPTMVQALEVLAVLLVSVSMALSLAHALELPGKLRLPREAYMAVQPMYYPGFTIGGFVGEFGGLVSTLVLLAVTPAEGAAFWLILVALFALIGAHAV